MREVTNIEKNYGKLDAEDLFPVSHMLHHEPPSEDGQMERLSGCCDFDGWEEWAMSKHTPTPWYCSETIETGIGVQPKHEWHIFRERGPFGNPAKANNAADAKFIVLACNSHSALLDGAEGLILLLHNLADIYDNQAAEWVLAQDSIKALKAAIALAEPRA